MGKPRCFSPVNGIYNVERLWQRWQVKTSRTCFSPVNGIYNVESRHHSELKTSQETLVSVP